MSSAPAIVYAALAAQALPRLLGTLDREPGSRSYGNFDREHWGWKFRDFPITMLQASVTSLVLAWRLPFAGNACHQNPRVQDWIEAALVATCRRQHRSGAFDSVGPNTRDHGVTLAMVHVLAHACRLLGDALPPGVGERVRETVARGCRFAKRSDEDYAFISNHRALFALAYLEAGDLLDDRDCRARSDAIVAEIVRRQSPDGWYLEYEGADPGYETLGIAYLARVWERTGSAVLHESLARSVDFLAHCVHPDGSLGGVYGSRHTQLYYPSGLERLGRTIPRAAAIASFLRPRLHEHNVVTPTTSDAENLPSLLHDYLDAASLPDRSPPDDPNGLPCVALDGVRCFPHSTLTVVGQPAYYAVALPAKGGVCRVFDRRSGRVVYEDAGYLVTARGRRWTSQALGLGRTVAPVAGGEVVCETTFVEVVQPLPSPASFLLLRALNLTLFRSGALGRWLRRRIIARLITGRRRGPFRLRRRLRFDREAVRIEDRIERTASRRVDAVRSMRAFTSIHMGSAKYFHASELLPLPTGDGEGLRRALNEQGIAEHRRTVELARTDEASDHREVRPAASGPAAAGSRH